MFDMADPSLYPAYNDNFNTLGYNSASFIYLIGSPLVFLEGLVALLLFYGFLFKLNL